MNLSVTSLQDYRLCPRCHGTPQSKSVGNVKLLIVSPICSTSKTDFIDAILEHCRTLSNIVEHWPHPRQRSLILDAIISRQQLRSIYDVFSSCNPIPTIYAGNHVAYAAMLRSRVSWPACGCSGGLRLTDLGTFIATTDTFPIAKLRSLQPFILHGTSIDRCCDGLKRLLCHANISKLPGVWYAGRFCMFIRFTAAMSNWIGTQLLSLEASPSFRPSCRNLESTA